MTKTIRIIDTNFAHCKYCGFPEYECQGFEWDRISLIKPTDIIVVTESNITNPQIYNSPNAKYAWLLECKEYPGNNYNWIKYNYHYYNNVLTHDKDLLQLIPNALWQPFGGCWISPKDLSINYQKTKLISTIISNKTFMTGHQLRHKIFNETKQIDFYGSYVRPIKFKIEALKDYKYHLCIENSRSPGYFTEKLIDCFATGCVPIYWGDPLIGEVFDTSGMIIVNSFSDIMDVINNKDRLDYDSFSEGVKHNFEICKNYVLPENYMYTNHSHIFNVI